MSSSAQSVIRFIAVGCAAAATHLAVVILLVGGLGQLPLAANVMGWLAAFVVSFSGHRLLTFRSRQVPLWRSARRFFSISAAAFGANELAYAALLHWSGLRYDLVLALVLVLVAAITYLLSSRWAFLGNAHG